MAITIRYYHEGNTFNGIKRAYLINPHGGYQNLTLDFELGNDVEVYYSCSLQWKNQYYVIGGSKLSQVSMLSGNRLERKRTLEFNFQNGGCAVLNQSTIVLCFDQYKPTVCHQSNNPLGSFTKLPNSKFIHENIRIASFDGKNTIF